MQPKATSLRKLLAITFLLLTLLVLGVAAALITSTNYIQRSSSLIGAAVESVRLAQEAEINLLVHQRALDPVARQELGERLLNRLEMAAAYVSTEEEALSLERSLRAVARYLATPRGEADAQLGEAYDALDRLVRINIAQARAAQEEAAHMSALADIIAFGVGALFLAVIGGLLWWLNRHGLRPVLRLGESMERFARGDLEARAPEAGPAELQEMARRFNEMAAALARQREGQLAFLGGVAHDLGNPLAAISLAASSAPRGRPLPPEPRLRQLLDLIEQQAGRMRRMLEDFLDTTRMDAGQLSLRLEHRDARGLLEEVARLHRPSSARHRISLSLPEEPVVLRCDPLRLEQVLSNLVSNAIKYSPAGGEVELSLQRGGGEAIFAVSDRGIGMSEEELRRAFEPFRRVGTLKDEVPGTGLGLYVVKQLVEAHGGRLEARSAPGHGSRFEVRLPLAE